MSLEEMQEQIERYSNYDEIKALPNLHKYIVIAVVDEIYVDKID